ncbi:CDP-alcohol phosphatidyltransferase family protein, partial [Micromonospora sp. NPDC047074]
MPTRSGEPLADRLTGQLRRAGAAEVRHAADLDELAALVDAATGPVLVTGADLVAHTAVLRHLATSPVGPTVALVLTDPPGHGRTAVREERGQVVGAGPPEALDGATGVFGGALRVGVNDRPSLAAGLRRGGRR